MKKCLCISVILIIMAVIIVLLFKLNLFYSNSYTEKFKEKIKLLDEYILKNDEINMLKDSQDEHIAILSICDNKTQAIVKKEKSTSMKKAYKNVKKQINDYIKESDYSVELIKIDFAKDIEQISMKEFEENLLNLEQEYTFRYGIIFEYQDRNDIILTEAELNSNNIIDYEECEIDLNKLNTYLNFCREDKVDNLPTELRKFTTISYFCDTDNQIYEIDATTGQRKQSSLNQKDINEMIDNATNYLFNMVEKNGKFIYGYSPLKNKENTSYNILRHAGSTWAMIKEWDSTIEQKQTIEGALNYLIDTVKYLDTETAYVEELKNDELKLGGNALAAIAICEYTDKFEDTRYLEILGELGNGIISMQRKDGGYIHVLNADDFSVKDEYRTVYYDGEATFALCKLYSVTNDKKYLEAAEKSVQYFIDNDYTQYCDHWIAYALNEITKHIDKEEYYEFGLKNISDNIEFMKNKTYTSHINFEMLLQGFELYYRILEKNLDIKYLEEFSIDKLIETINYRAHFQLNSYLYPEIAMYLKHPEIYSDTFYIRHSNYRIRIDDIQHSILGYHFYNNNFEKIQEMQKSM